MRGVSALLNNSQAIWDIRHEERATETVKIVWAIENGYASLRLYQTGRRINLDLARFRFEAIAASIKAAYRHDIIPVLRTVIGARIFPEGDYENEGPSEILIPWGFRVR